MNRRWIFVIIAGLLVGGAVLLADVFPIRFDDVAGPSVAAGASDGLIVAQSILLTTVTTEPFTCDASTEGALIYVGDTNGAADRRPCYCRADLGWVHMGLGPCGFQT